MSEELNCSILAMEYPGYGFFTHEILDGRANPNKPLHTTANHIKECARTVFRNVVAPITSSGLGFSPADVMVFGRSIGSGPACVLAKEFRPGGLVLLSPFTSVKKAAASFVGSFLALFLSEHFDNLECIKQIQCSVLFVHGELDHIVPVK